MKKLLHLIPVVAASILSAQTHFGLKAGYSLSHMKWENVSLEDKSYFYAGGFVEHYLSQKVSLQGELLYTEIGGSFQEEIMQLIGSEIVSMGTITLKMKYPQLQIPVSVKYYPEEKLGLSGGLNFAANLGAKVKTDPKSNLSGTIDGVHTINTYPFLGAEYHVMENLSVEARYNFGLFNMHSSDLKVKSGFLQAGLAYRLK